MANYNQSSNDGRMEQLVFENVKLKYVNFRGIDRAGNKTQNPTFNIVLTDDEATSLSEQGYNIYWPQRRPDVDYPEDWEPTPQLRVKVGTVRDGIKPFVRIVIVDDEAELSYRIPSDDVEQIDAIDTKYYVHSADVVVSPYHYNNAFGEGITCNVSSVYLHVSERTNNDPFYDKYLGGKGGDM